MHRDAHGWGFAIFLNKPAEPVLNKQTLQNPRGASAKILAPHFGQTLGALIIFPLCRSFRISLYCPKIVPRSRLQNRNEMPELVFDIGRHCDGVRDLLA